jgi:hypothetical protein
VPSSLDDLHRLVEAVPHLAKRPMSLFCRKLFPFEIEDSLPSFSIPEEEAAVVFD